MTLIMILHIRNTLNKKCGPYEKKSVKIERTVEK